jgi:hypothetical protein
MKQFCMPMCEISIHVRIDSYHIFKYVAIFYDRIFEKIIRIDRFRLTPEDGINKVTPATAWFFSVLVGGTA